MRTDWTIDEIAGLYDLPFHDLMFEAHRVHRENFNPSEIQMSTLLSIKTGGCPEDCKYCPQSAHFDTGVKAEKLLDSDVILSAAKRAKAEGATRFCMGAAWRSPKERDMPKLMETIAAVKAEGLETCATLGMLDASQAERLKDAGLDYYNHNLDSSESFYKTIITTRTYDERLDTLATVRAAGMKVCCGGIIGMGESRQDRIELLRNLANQESHPESVPINLLVQVAGTPMQGMEPLESFEFIRTVAVARLLMPKSHVRLSAGREEMSDEMQAWCFFAGANSIFFGDTLLTTSNPQVEKDKALFKTLGLTAESAVAA
tara:strand:- start:979 stop:1929 length:951 start_codon:yes stop_codon:yes gene_type:complete